MPLCKNGGQQVGLNEFVMPLTLYNQGYIGFNSIFLIKLSAQCMVCAPLQALEEVMSKSILHSGVGSLCVHCHGNQNAISIGMCVDVG